jgi:CubicO group peptidase (beta-lactamase class C family)
VLSFDEGGLRHAGCSAELAKVLDDAFKEKRIVRCVAFTSRDDWFCLTNDGWWTSDVNHPVSKSLAERAKEGQSMKWVAVAPVLGPHDFKKWSEIIHKAYDGKLAGGYGFEVRHEGKIVASGTEGWARAPWEKQSPSVPWTLTKPMGVASVSKTITAVGLLKLWEETNHSFSLDDPFWPHIKAICPTANAEVKKITLRELLRHRGGFKKEKDYSTPKDIEKLLNEPLAHPPGTHQEYDNNNYYIARLALEQISHGDYTPYIKEHVLKPMGITDMQTHFEAHQPMCGYTKQGEQRAGFPFDWKCESTAGAAGWYGSVTDLGLFLHGLREHKCLNPETTALMNQDNLGWDSSNPAWEKNGGWNWDEGTRAGSLHSVIAHFPDDVDAVLLANAETPVDVVELVIRAWRESMK